MDARVEAAIAAYAEAAKRAELSGLKAEAALVAYQRAGQESDEAFVDEREARKALVAAIKEAEGIE